eukprot:scaffold253416_cov32-Tisochrysis_lutea.AAC.1
MAGAVQSSEACRPPPPHSTCAPAARGRCSRAAGTCMRKSCLQRLRPRPGGTDQVSGAGRAGSAYPHRKCSADPSPSAAPPFLPLLRCHTLPAGHRSPPLAPPPSSDVQQKYPPGPWVYL